MGCTTWRLNLGEGLDFQLKVFPPPQKKTNALWDPLCKSNKFVPTCGRSGKEKGKIALRWSALAATTNSLLYKVHSTDRSVFVAKVFRNPDLRKAVRAWRNEVDIHKNLSHVSKRIKYIYLANL